jgi:hypothetical protein
VLSTTIPLGVEADADSVTLIREIAPVKSALPAMTARANPSVKKPLLSWKGRM